MTKYYSDWYLNRSTNERWAYIDGLFTESECKSIIDTFKNSTEEGTIGQDKSTNNNIRKSNVHFINSNDEDNYWIFGKVSEGIMHINKNYFNFDIEKIESLQFSEYSSSYKGFYNKHIDTQYTNPGMNTRKLSFSILLSKEEDFAGGELLLHLGNNPDSVLSTQGKMTMFPSYTLHEVTPVTSGTRYSLVGWACGPNFK